MSVEHENFKLLLGKEIEKRRLSLKWSVREFASLAQIEHHQLINIEKGRVDVRLSTLLKISTALNIELKELLSF